MTAERAPIHRSASTWQQPCPPPASGQRGALVSEMAERVLARGSGRLLVGVDGHTAAGKTSFGHELAEAVAAAGRPVLRASLDDFKRPWRDRHLYDRESGEGYYRNAYDYDAARRLLLEPARSPQAESCSLCAIDPLTQRDHSADTTPLTPDSVLIVDGVFAFRPEIDDHWDFRIWLHIDPELSVRRGTERDRGKAPGQDDSQDQSQSDQDQDQNQDQAQDQPGSDSGSPHRDRYLASELLYLSEADPLPRMDAVIDNSRFGRPHTLAPGSR